MVWSINVNRNLNDGELGEYEGLLQLLAKQNISSGDDRLLWKLEKNDTFSVSCYQFLCMKSDVGRGILPAKQIWNTKVPPCVAFFSWEVCWEDILTIDKLKITAASW